MGAGEEDNTKQQEANVLAAGDITNEIRNEGGEDGETVSEEPVNNEPVQEAISPEEQAIDVGDAAPVDVIEIQTNSGEVVVGDTEKSSDNADVIGTEGIAEPIDELVILVLAEF
jgi:hypothetical protein